MFCSIAWRLCLAKQRWCRGSWASWICKCLRQVRAMSCSPTPLQPATCYSKKKAVLAGESLKCSESKSSWLQELNYNQCVVRISRCLLLTELRKCKDRLLCVCWAVVASSFYLHLLLLASFAILAMLCSEPSKDRVGPAQRLSHTNYCVLLQFCLPVCCVVSLFCIQQLPDIPGIAASSTKNSEKTDYARLMFVSLCEGWREWLHAAYDVVHC